MWTALGPATLDRKQNNHQLINELNSDSDLKTLFIRGQMSRALTAQRLFQLLCPVLTLWTSLSVSTWLQSLLLIVHCRMPVHSAVPYEAVNHYNTSVSSPVINYQYQTVFYRFTDAARYFLLLIILIIIYLVSLHGFKRQDMRTCLVISDWEKIQFN